jgi:hypothetical protein
MPWRACCSIEWQFSELVLIRLQQGETERTQNVSVEAAQQPSPHLPTAGQRLSGPEDNGPDAVTWSPPIEHFLRATVEYGRPLAQLERGTQAASCRDRTRTALYSMTTSRSYPDLPLLEVDPPAHPEHSPLLHVQSGNAPAHSARLDEFTVRQGREWRRKVDAAKETSNRKRTEHRSRAGWTAGLHTIDARARLHENFNFRATM